MPRPRAYYKARHGIPPGVRDDITALALDGTVPDSEIAARYGVDVAVVRALADQAQLIDPEHVAHLRRALPALLTILAAAHATEGIRRAATDPATAAKSTFGAKMAVEAARLANPQSEAPGRHMLQFVQGLQIQVAVTPAHELPPPVSEPVDITCDLAALAAAAEGPALPPSLSP